jgi:hypothetical protein
VISSLLRFISGVAECDWRFFQGTPIVRSGDENRIHAVSLRERRRRTTLNAWSERGRMMPPIRYRIRTIMMVIAAVAVHLGLLRLAIQHDDTLTLGLFIVQIGLFMLYGWFLRTRQRQLS